MNKIKIIEALESQGLQNPTDEDIENFKNHLDELAENETTKWAKMVALVGATEYRNGKLYLPTVEEISTSTGGRKIKAVFLKRYQILFT